MVIRGEEEEVEVEEKDEAKITITHYPEDVNMYFHLHTRIKLNDEKNESKKTRKKSLPSPQTRLVHVLPHLRLDTPTSTPPPPSLPPLKESLIPTCVHTFAHETLPAAHFSTTSSTKEESPTCPS